MRKVKAKSQSSAALKRESAGLWNDQLVCHLPSLRTNAAELKALKQQGYKAVCIAPVWPMLIKADGLRPNIEGISQLNQLVKDIKGSGLIPIAVLHHWKLPLWVKENGTWKNYRTAERFTMFRSAMYKHFSQHVSIWELDKDNLRLMKEELNLLQANQKPYTLERKPLFQTTATAQKLWMEV